MDDKELILLCKKGNRKAFEQLVEKYQNKIVNIAYGMLSNTEDASDAAQEVFIKVYRGLDSFKEQSSFSTWIYRITANVCTDVLRKRQRRISAISIDASNDNEDEKKLDIPDEKATPEEEICRNEQQAMVRKAISELNEDYRFVLTMYDIQGANYQEISDTLGISLGTVKSRLFRARKELKKKLEAQKDIFLSG